jgi:hypothetical protein
MPTPVGLERDEDELGQMVRDEREDVSDDGPQELQARDRRRHGSAAAGFWPGTPAAGTASGVGATVTPGPGVTPGTPGLPAWACGAGQSFCGGVIA